MTATAIDVSRVLLLSVLLSPSAKPTLNTMRESYCTDAAYILAQARLRPWKRISMAGSTSSAAAVTSWGRVLVMLSREQSPNTLSFLSCSLNNTTWWLVVQHAKIPLNIMQGRQMFRIKQTIPMPCPMPLPLKAHSCLSKQTLIHNIKY